MGILGHTLYDRNGNFEWGEDALHREHTFTVRRPVIFNGIPGDLTERSDLASRTIKLEIPRIVQRRTKSDLEREFEKIWPGVLGALLDGLVGGLRDQASVVVDDPAIDGLRTVC